MDCPNIIGEMHCNCNFDKKVTPSCIDNNKYINCKVFILNQKYEKIRAKVNLAIEFAEKQDLDNVLLILKEELILIDNKDCRMKLL